MIRNLRFIESNFRGTMHTDSPGVQLENGHILQNLVIVICAKFEVKRFEICFKRYIQMLRHLLQTFAWLGGNCYHPVPSAGKFAWTKSRLIWFRAWLAEKQTGLLWLARTFYTSFQPHNCAKCANQSEETCLLLGQSGAKSNQAWLGSREFSRACSPKYKTKQTHNIAFETRLGHLETFLSNIFI